MFQLIFFNTQNFFAICDTVIPVGWYFIDVCPFATGQVQDFEIVSLSSNTHFETWYNSLLYFSKVKKSIKWKLRTWFGSPVLTSS